MTRRRFAAIGGAGALAAFADSRRLLPKARATVRFSAYPFALGVASGDPHPDGVVLWTRLAPEPLHGGGMPNRAAPVRWEVAHDEGFKKIAAAGETLARPELAHAVHVEVSHLHPAREYFYRFTAGREESPVGRTRTAPEPGAKRPLSFAFASCQHLEHGFYTAYGHMADEDLDVVLHLGDYMYEFGPREYPARSGAVRTYSSPEPTTLDGYRARYAEHRSDTDLQAAHRAFPWVVTWDDHEVKDNYAGERCSGIDPEVFARRRAGAYQAYYEHMPLRRASIPRPSGMRLHRRIDYGDLVRFNVLDTRQYRSVQVPTSSAGNDDPRRTMMGMRQERWLANGLSGSRATWNVVAQQVFFAQRDRDPDSESGLSTDSWDGYPAARDRLSAAIARPGVSNPIVLSGDVHSNWASNLLADYEDPASRVIGTEFVGTSISSGGDGGDRSPDALLAANPHIKFSNGQRGYVRCHVGESEWRTDFRVVPFVSRRGAPVSTRASFVVRDGEPGLSAG